MSRQKLLQQVVGATLVIVFLVGCGAPAATPMSEATAATSTLVPSAATPTSKPPTPTPTPVPPTPTPIPPTPTPTAIPASFTITGRIANLGEFSEYIVEGSSLQLVRLSDEAIANQQVMLSLAFSADGTMEVVSDLAKIPVPLDGFFAFELESLEPGMYLVVVQLAYSEGSWANIMALTIQNEGELAVVRGDLKYKEATDQFIRYISLSQENSMKIAMFEIVADAQTPLQYDFGEVFISKLPVRVP